LRISYRYGLLLLVVALPLLLASLLPTYVAESGDLAAGAADVPLFVNGSTGMRAVVMSPVVANSSVDLDRYELLLYVNLTRFSGEAQFVLYNGSSLGWTLPRSSTGVLYAAANASPTRFGLGKAYIERGLVGGKAYEVAELNMSEHLVNATAVVYASEGASGTVYLSESQRTLPVSPLALPVSLVIMASGVVLAAAGLLAGRRGELPRSRGGSDREAAPSTSPAKPAAGFKAIVSPFCAGARRVSEKKWTKEEEEGERGLRACRACGAIP